MSYLPSKKLVAVFVFVSLIVGGVFWFSDKKERGLATESATRFFNTSASPSLAAEDDSDADGLKNWEETLRGTDPQNPDTDGDGVQDGKEVASNRNPLLKGPNDERAEIFSVEAARAQEMQDPLGAATAQFRQAYLSRGKPYDQFSEEERNALTFAAITPAVQILPRPYAASDMRTTDNSSAAQAQYLNQVGETLNQTFAQVSESAVALFQDYTASNDGSLLLRLTPEREASEEAERLLQGVPAPPVFAQAHAELLNILHNTGSAISALQQAERDRVTALVAAGWYLHEAEASRALLQTLGDAIADNKLALQPEEPGYLFVTYAKRAHTIE